MKFDIDSARKAGYSDDEIADYLATENKFDLSGAIESGYSARDVIDYLSAPKGGKQDLPADVAPSTAGAGRGSVNPAPVDNRGIIQRVADYLKPEPKSVMEGYQPTPQELQADVDRRLSYGAGPISSQTAAQADLVRSGMAKTDSKVVQRTAEGMERTKAPSIGDLMQRASNPENERAARESKAEEFRTPGEWAVDMLSNVSQGTVGLVQLPINIIAPSSEIAKTLRDTQQELQNAESDVLRANRERLKERVLSESGFLDRYVATVKELVTNPALSISEAAKQVPNFLGVVGAAKTAKGLFNVGMNAAEAAAPTLALGEAISGGAARAAGQAVATHAGGAAASMVMAGGDAAGDTFERLTDRKQTPLSVWKQNPDYQKLVAEGKSSNDAITEIATTKARMAALITAPLGLLGYAGAEAAVASKGLGRATTEALTIKGAAKTAGKDWAGEQLEEGGTQLGSNIVKQTVDPSQSLSEGVPEAMATAAVTSAPYSALGARAAYKDAINTPPDQIVAGRIADTLIGQEQADPRLTNPLDTVRSEEQVGPNAPPRAAQIVNFTEPDSATAQAGLTPIVVPVPTAQAPAETAAAVELPPVNPSTEQAFGLDKLRMRSADVSTGSAVDAQPSVGGVAGGNQPGGSVDLSRLDVAGAGELAGRTAGVPAANAGQAVAAGDGAAQQPAGVTPPTYNNAVAQPTEQWFGRKGDGYATEADAQQALPGRKRMFPELEWKVEAMPSGKFRLAGYESKIETPGVAGEKINDEWTQFAPESGTRGIPRAEMPQVKSNQRGALVNFLDARGITSTQEEVPASELKPTQAEFSPSKVKSAKEFPYGDRSILVSSDNHVVDGHHQWLAKLDANEPVKIIRLSAPIDEVISAVREFPSSTTAEGATLGTETTQAVQAKAQGQETAAGAGVVAAAGPAGAPTELQGARVPGLTQAPTAPLRDFAKFQQAVAADGIEIAPLRANEMNTQHQIASAVARVLGKTYTVARVTSGNPMALSNGMVDKLGGKHIVAAENSDDAPLFVAIHEAYHGLPEQQRKALNTQLLQLFRAENKDRFLKEFKYTEAQFEEEAPAFIAQVVSKRADFWEELRTKMGNREFADVAKLVLGTLNQIVRKVTSQYGKDFADTYISDIVKARDLLSTAYAEAIKAQGLTPDVEVDTRVAASNKADIGAALQQRVDNDFDALVQEYNALRGTDGGRILDTDIARELSPEYRADRSRAAEIHEAASAFIQKLFETRMAAPHNGEAVVIMAGGGGSGKSSAKDILGAEYAGAGTVLDGTLSSLDKARRNVQRVLDSGRTASVMYVYREPVEALRNGVLTRAMRGGRTVPIDALVKAHAGASDVMRQLSKDYAGSEDVAIRVIDNSRGPGGAVQSSLENITPVIKSGLKERFTNATEEEFKAGRISETVYRATIGDAGAEAQVAREAAADDAGARREAVQGRGSVGQRDAVRRSNKGGKETAADHKLSITREERELADKTKLTRDELAKIKDSAQRFNLQPRMIEMEVRRIKSRFPESAGWAPLEFLRVDPKVMEKKAKESNPLPSDAIFFVEQPYQFHLDPKAGKDAKDTHDQRVKTMASALAGEIMEKYMAAQRGDPVAKIIMRQSNWYRALRSKLRSTFGGFGDFFAQLLGPTSANNPVEPNFKYAVEALKMATSGKWDNMFKEIAAWRADIDAAAANLDAVIAMVKASGGKAVMSDPRVVDAQKALKEAAVYKGTIPKRENGKMFGMATAGIVQILGERWGDKQMGDAPKTKNYYQNIVGRTIDATIDVWAARTLRRLANDTVGNFPRIPTVAEGAVAGSVLADNVTSGSEFGFGQEVFREAADELRASGVEQFRDTTPNAVQAMIWFSEKELWARRGWTSKIGEEGSIEHELLLAGYANREQVDKWRSAARAGKPDPATKAFQLKDADKAKQKYEKVFAEWSEAKRVAEEMLAQIESYPDRFVGGITLEIPNDKPTDAEMAGAGRELDSAIGDDGVIAKRAQTTTGEFMGDVERTIDLEFVVRNGYNPTAVWNKLVEISDREGQMATFLSRTLRADELENIDYTRQRPGIELYFAKPISKFDAAAMMAVINNAGVHGMTLATEGRKTVSSQAGEEQPIVGIRMQHIPEFMLGYGYEADFTDAIIEQSILAARDKMTALVEELDKRADISTVTRHWYETKVHFYGINERTVAAGSAEGDRGVWAGQSVREGLADAARFARENQDALGTRRAELLRERAVSRGDAEQGAVQRSNRASGSAELARGPGARTDEGTGRAVTGIHYGKAAGLSRLSGTAFGSGIKGAEQARLAEPGVDPRIKKRVYFYLTNNNADMPRPEIGLGAHVYRATLGNMFDMSTATAADKARVQSLRKTSDANGFESAVLDAGFRGYVNREQGTAVVLNADVPVAYEGMAQAGKMRDRVIERAAPAVTTRTEGDELVRKPSNDEMAGIIKARPALAETAPSFKLQFGEARVKASEAAEADRVLADAGASFQFGGVMASRRAQTETPTFKRWFGDSKVVDADGKPLVVYHGTRANFDAFNTDAGAHFGSREQAQDRAGGDGELMPVYLSIKNPKRVIDAGSDWADEIELAKQDGHDGIVYLNRGEGLGDDVNEDAIADAQTDAQFKVAAPMASDSYIAFRPEQIKSATGNEGAFDPESPSILKSNRARESWFIGRDELGRPTIGAGARAYRVAADLANNVLARVAMKPIDKDLSRAMRKMKVEIEQARLLTADAAEHLGKLSEDERTMISDVIEGELKRGVKPPQRVLEVAASMQGIMSEQTAELVRLGMLSEDAAGRWDGKYLPRFYESKLMDEGKKWVKAAKSLMGRPRTMQGIKGSSLKGRGIFQTVPVEELEQWLADGWQERDPKFNPDTDTEITVWRDYSREERENMGEIRDAMFRFVMGYTKSQQDIALGRLYEQLANTVASKHEQEGYVQVPSTNVEDTKARRYGKLAGKWVPQEVMDHLSATDNSMQSDVMKFYMKALSMWKEGKTVLNPVSHANNVLSNLTVAHFAGVSYWDVHKYLGATRDLVKNSPMVQEARDAGLFGGTISQAELVNMLPEQLKVLAARTESKAAQGVEHLWNALSFWLRKPMGKAYEAEDLFFRYLIYRDARQRGLEADDAVEYAQKYIFTYDDLPKGARMVRNFAMPFFSYTYKVVPMLAQTALETPWRYAAPAAALYTINAIMYAFAAGAGEDDDDWMSIIKRYLTDAEFRNKAKAMEEDERKNLPSWMKGASLTLGTSKSIRLGVDEATDLPVFLDVSRMFPGGDLFDAQNNAGGVPLLAPITPNNPLLTAASSILFNKDSFTGKEVVKKTDTSAEAAAKRAEWAWRQFTPAIAVGNYHFDRAMNVIANVTGEPVNLGIKEYTGVGRDGQPIQPKYAAMQTLGIKARPIDLELSAKIDQSQTNAMIRDMDAQIRSLRRLANKGAISDVAMEKETDVLREKRQRLKEGLTVDGEEK